MTSIPPAFQTKNENTALRNKSILRCIVAHIGARAIAFLASTLLLPAVAIGQVALINGGNHSGAISSVGERDTWNLSLAAGDQIFLRVSQTSGGTAFAPRLRLLDAEGNLVGTALSATDSSTSSARLDGRSASTGAHTLVVDSSLTNGTGNYRVDYIRLPGTVTTPAGETGGPMNNEGRHEGAIALGDVDAWTFTADAGQLVELRAGETAGGNPFVSRLRVFDMTGQLVAYAEGGAASSTSEARLSFRPATTNAFTVVVDSSATEGTGNYRLHLVKLPATVAIPSGDHGAVLVSGGRAEGTITLGDVDTWTLDADAGDRVLLRAAQLVASDSLAPRLRVFDTNGALVATAVAADAAIINEARLECVLPSAGRFTVLVDSWEAEGTGGYRLHYLKIPGPFIIPSGDDGGALTSGNNHDGSTVLGDVDVWTFDATAGNRVTLNLSELTGGTTYAPRLWVYDAAGGLVGYDDSPSVGATQTSLAFIIATGGSFKVVVDSSLVDGAGTYRLNYALEAGPFTYPPVNGTPLLNGGNHEGTIITNETDSWTFSATAGETVWVRIASEAIYPVFTIHAPGGQEVARSGDGNYRDYGAAFVAGQAGMFTVRARSFYQGQNGAYSLRFAKVPGDFTIPGGDEGGVMENGGNYEGTLPVGDLDLWTFTAKAGEVVWLRMATANIYPSFIVYGTDGREVARGGEGNYRDWMKGFVVAQEGTFTVVVQGYYANQAGTYHLRLAKVPGNFITPGGDDGGGMENGGNYEGSITLGDLDLWTFTAEAGDLVLLRMGTAGIYPSFIVYGADGREVARGEDGNYRDKAISFAAAKSETFTVLVQSYYVTGDGSYNLRLAKVPGEFIIPGGDEGGLMENGGNHEGSITIGDVDIWTFTAEAGDLVSFRIGTTDIYPFFTVHGMDGREVARSGDGNYRDGGTAFVATQGGTYTVLVQSYYATGDGAYNLRLAKVPGQFIIPGGDEGGPLTNGDNHQGAIFLGDVDLWTLNARMGDVVWLRVATTDIYPSFAVHGPDGQIVVRGGDGNYRDAATSFVAPQNGTFTVQIGSYYLGGDGTYALRLAQIPDRFTVPPDDEGGPLANGTNQLSAILHGDIDLWTFEADQGQNLLIRMQELSGNVSPSLRLYGPTGTLIASHTHDTLAQLSLRAPDGGIYTLMTSSGVLGGSGTYQLLVSGLPEQGRQLRFSRQSTPQERTFTINWPTELGGYVLQQNSVVSDDGWVDVGEPNLANGLNTRFTLPIGQGNRFFRLRPPAQ